MQSSYIGMLAFAIFLELAGGLLLIFNSTWGAVLLVSACILNCPRITRHFMNSLLPACRAGLYPKPKYIFINVITLKPGHLGPGLLGEAPLLLVQDESNIFDSPTQLRTCRCFMECFLCLCLAGASGNTRGVSKCGTSSKSRALPRIPKGCIICPRHCIIAQTAVSTGASK